MDGRRTWIDGFTRALDRVDVIDGYVPYFFHDLHAKVTSDLGGVRRLSVSGYMNSESLNDIDAREQVTEKMAMTWGNAAFSVHYRDRLGATGIVDANLGHSRFTNDLVNVRDYPVAIDDDGKEHDPPPDTLLFGRGLMGESRADLKLVWHAHRATITAGTQAARFEADYDYYLSDRCCSWDDLDVSDFLSPLVARETGWRLAAYSIVEVPLRRGFSTRAGLRLDRFQGLATTLAPFAELSYGASWWRGRISAARSHQQLASVRNEESLVASFLAYDLLFPVGRAPVPRNTEFQIGWQGSRGGLRVRLEAYARALDNIRLPDLEANPIKAKVLEDPSRWKVASGTALGIEASWSWVWDRGISVLGSYRWARVSRTVGSRTYTPRFHRDHEFEFGSSFRRGASSWSARVSLRSGQPVHARACHRPGCAAPKSPRRLCGARRRIQFGEAAVLRPDRRGMAPGERGVVVRRRVGGTVRLRGQPLQPAQCGRVGAGRLFWQAPPASLPEPAPDDPGPRRGVPVLRTRLWCGLVAPALTASPGCETTRPFELHPDVVALAVLLVVGESEARMLAIHPNREAGAAPEVTATLHGPGGWTAAFTDAAGAGDVHTRQALAESRQVSARGTSGGHCTHRRVQSSRNGTPGFVHRGDRGARRTDSGGAGGHLAAAPAGRSRRDPDPYPVPGRRGYRHSASGYPGGLRNTGRRYGKGTLRRGSRPLPPACRGCRGRHGLDKAARKTPALLPAAPGNRVELYELH